MNARIERLQRQSAQDGRIVCLAGGLPAAELAWRAMQQACARAVARRDAPALQYGWPEGIEPLRAFVAARLRARGAAVAAGEVIMTAGAQQAIALAVQLTSRPGERIGTGAICYPAALDLIRSHGARPAALDLIRSRSARPAVLDLIRSHGARPAALDLTRSRGARPAAGDVVAHYVMPEVANPDGSTLGADERARLLASGLPLIEDDAYAELRFDGAPGRPLLAEARSRVWHVGTFSKTLSPGLRLGWLVPPPRFRERALRWKRDQDLQASSLGQSVLARFLERDDWEARLERLRRHYARRAERLYRAVRRHLPGFSVVEPAGGFSLWLECDEAFDDADFLQTALEHGVSFDPGRLFRPHAAGQPLALRVSFSLESPARLDEGARRLGRAFAAFRHRARRARPARPQRSARGDRPAQPHRRSRAARAPLARNQRPRALSNPE